MQWIDTDKNDHLRTEGGEEIEPIHKARLVARGDQQKSYSRTDSPTADSEALFIICSYAASCKLRIKSGDVENAYFQGEKPTRPLLLRQPKGGIPDDDVNDEDYLLALVPIYGTKDAGRSFWKRIRSVMLESGMVENFVFKACYSYAIDGVIQIIMATHVDDIVWACRPGAET